MPELPEVQTIVSDLAKILPGLKIRDIWFDFEKMIKLPKNSDQFKKIIIGKKIIKVDRRGKNILIGLSGGFILLVHQKMTGHFLYGRYEKTKKNGKEIWLAGESGPLRDDSYNQYIHFLIDLSNGKQLAFSDLRKFAKILLAKEKEIKELPEIKNLGPDPLAKKFSFTDFEKIISDKKTKIKKFLMDQTAISGIGNIYSDEILWEAGAHPFKNTSSLSIQDKKNIFKAIKKILPIAVKTKGDSMSDYRRPSGEKGSYQNIQKAYRQTGKKCAKNDGGAIKRVKIGGRSAHFCPVHQKL